MVDGKETHEGRDWTVRVDVVLKKKIVWKMNATFRSVQHLKTCPLPKPLPIFEKDHQECKTPLSEIPIPLQFACLPSCITACNALGGSPLPHTLWHELTTAVITSDAHVPYYWTLCTVWNYVSKKMETEKDLNKYEMKCVFDPDLKWPELPDRIGIQGRTNKESNTATFEVTSSSQVHVMGVLQNN